MKKLVSSVVALTSVIAGFSITTGVFALGISSDEKVIYSDTNMTSVVEHSKNDYEVNCNGQTYGSGFNVTYVEDLPDLISVVGDNGKVGYVRTDEFLGDAPSSPEEAMKIQESLDNGTYKPIVYNVYSSDGKTIIDTFTEGIE